MKKTIIVKYPSSEDEKYLVKLNMGSYYKEFINEIPDNLKEREERLKNGISCIIWCAFYLEAAINEACLYILEDGISGTIKDVNIIWPFIEKEKTEKKLELILSTMVIDEETKNKYRNKVISLFKLRNKLAHYNEKPNEIDVSTLKIDPSDSEENKRKIRYDAASKATPEIVNEILSISIKDRRETIIEIGEWIEGAIFEYY